MRLSNILLLVAVLVVAVTVFLVTRPGEEPSDTTESKELIWQFDMEELTHIIIELPHLEMSESFAKHEDRQWYFDDPPGPQVDSDRWGGGIPLILSSPSAERPITKDATEEQLDIYGFTLPSMKLTLTKEDTEVIIIEIGDALPSSDNRYIRLADSDDVYVIVGIWHEVLENLVLEPPYPPEEEE